MENATGSDLKTCVEALRSAQKSMRIAFLLSLAASCIVLLMVANLWGSRQIRNTALIGHPSSEQQTEYLKEFDKHIADDSFYQVPALGIQITCENVGILGPLALLAFSFYCALTFKAYYCQVHCAAKEGFRESPLIMALLESESPTPVANSMLPTLRTFLFLPIFTCACLIFYEVFAHLLPAFRTIPFGGDPLREVLIKNHILVWVFDSIGICVAVLVLLSNLEAFRLSCKASQESNNCLKEREASKLDHAVAVMAAGASAQ